MPKNNIPNDNPLLQMEILDNPLAPEESKDLMISPAQELEQKIDMLTEIDSIATITKQQLSIRRQRVELEVENKKLDAGKKIIDAADRLIDRVLEKGEAVEIKTALDLKLYAEAIERLVNTNKMLMNSNVADEFGGRKRTKILASFRTAQGDQATIAAEIPSND